MKRRDFLRFAGGAVAGSTLLNMATPAQSPGGKRPNILWITCEDISPHLGCYGDAEARTPNLDGLARGGARYENAFSISGVCAPSRSCLITGMYPVTLGTHHMRCKRTPKPPVKCFPSYLRDAGYYCTNNVKTDYNFDVPKDAWDECSRRAHWRRRKDSSQPFFAVFNFTTTHESRIGTLKELAELRPEDRHDPAKANLPPYYPDTPVTRRHWAHYYDLVTVMDQQAGNTLRQLEEDGYADNTIVFYFSDHGVGLPRAKRWMYECGTHVPFLVRWPGRVERGSVTDRLVSFVDFAPTVLSIAGVPIPKHMQGTPFLGDQAGPARDYVFSARDRMDERYDIIRAVRDKRFRYIRNYEPDRPYAQYLTYPEGFPVMQEMRRVQRAGELKGPEKLFFRERKPVEELYDVAADPHELVNLAESADHQDVLRRLRAALDRWVLDTKDHGLVPEMELDAWFQAETSQARRKVKANYKKLPKVGEDAAVFGRGVNQWIEALNQENPYVRLQGIRALGLIGADASGVLLEALDDPEAAVAYWAAVGLGHIEGGEERINKALLAKRDHGAVCVRLAVAQALCRRGMKEQGLPVALDLAKDDDPPVRLFAVQILEESGLESDAALEALKAAAKDETKYVVRVAEHALALAGG